MLEARYEFPYLAHAALEPLNAVARMGEDGVLEIWAGHQSPDFYQAAAAQVAGITPDKVRLHVMKTGGGFGRRGVLDADIIVEAVAAAQAIGWRAPVKVQWTREDDMKGGKYRPAFVHAVKAGLDARWPAHRLGAAHRRAIAPEGQPVRVVHGQDGIDPASVEGAWNLPYAIPNRTVGLTTTEVGVPVLWWRSVGSTHTAYVIETFLDELAEAAGADPLDFRLALLPPRHANVLRLAAEKAGWGTPAPEGRARGLALAESFHTIVAQVAEVSVGEGGVKVHKVVCAVDCGVPINPDNIRAQMEGGIGFGLGAILAEELTLDGGRGRPGELRHLHAAAHRRHARGRGAYRALDRAAHRRRRARRAADRPGGRQRDRRRDRQAHPRAADRQGDAGLTAGRDALAGGRLVLSGGRVV